MGFSYTWLQLSQFLIVTLLMSHWLACLWGYVGGAATHTDEEIARHESFLTEIPLWLYPCRDLCGAHWIATKASFSC